MQKKIEREITKLEKEKKIKELQKNKIEEEINECSNKLKQLYSLQNEFKKLEGNVNKYFNPTKETE